MENQFGRQRTPYSRQNFDQVAIMENHYEPHAVRISPLGIILYQSVVQYRVSAMYRKCPFREVSVILCTVNLFIIISATEKLEKNKTNSNEWGRSGADPGL